MSENLNPENWNVEASGVSGTMVQPNAFVPKYVINKNGVTQGSIPTSERGPHSYALPEGFDTLYQKLEWLAVAHQNLDRSEFSSCENGELDNPNAKYILMWDGNQGKNIEKETEIWHYLGYVTILHCNLYIRCPKGEEPGKIPTPVIDATALQNALNPVPTV